MCVQKTHTSNSKTSWHISVRYLFPAIYRRQHFQSLWARILLTNNGFNRPIRAPSFLPGQHFEAHSEIDLLKIITYETCKTL